MTKASTWERVYAGFYRRIGSNGQTVIAQVGRQDNGKWAYAVLPFGKPSLSWEVTGQATLAEAQRMAEAGYRRYMSEYRAANAK